MISQRYLLPGQTEGRRNAFLEWKSTDLSYKLCLTCGSNVNYYKCVHRSISTRWDREHVGNFQNKSVSSPFNWVQVYALLGKIELERKVFFRVWKNGGHIFRLPPRALGCHKRWKSLSFCKIWNNQNPSLFFIRHPYR